MKHRTQQKIKVTSINVSFNGETWLQVSDIAKSGFDDPHYMVLHDSHEGGWIQFGDGKHGRKPPSDSEVVVSYQCENNQGTECIKVRLEKNHPKQIQDVPLWIIIHNRTEAIEFGHYEREPVSIRPLCFGSKVPTLWFVFTTILLVFILLLVIGTL
jgi:hypothetical protein